MGKTRRFVTITLDLELSENPSKNEVIDALAQEIIDCGVLPFKKDDKVEITVAGG